MASKQSVINRYGLQHYDELELEAYCYRTNRLPEQGGLGRAAHFLNIVELIWGKHNKKRYCRIRSKDGELNPWWEVMNEVVHRDESISEGGVRQQRYVGFSGCASCVAAETRIVNPITGEQPTILELYERGEQPIVMTLNGPRLASVPFIKGREKLYKITLSNGHSFTATAEHRVRIADAYVRVESLRCGQRLLGYAPCPPVSNSACVPSVHVSNVPNFQKKVEDFQSDYPVCSRFGDGQLRLASDTCLMPAPLPSDALARNLCVYGDAGDLDAVLRHNHSCQSSCRLSNSSIRGHNAQLNNALLQIPLAPRTPLHFYPAFPRLSPSLSRMRLQHSSLEPVRDFWRKPSSYEFFDATNHSCVDYEVSEVVVQAISTTEEADFFDLHVPIENHYFAEGAIHHNSAKTDFCALYAIINWMIAPQDTLVLVTSTDMKAARRRIWGRIVAYYDAMPEEIKPGSLIASQYQIVAVNDKGKKLSDESSITLVPGEKKHEREALDKIIGAHNKRVFFICDELPELSEAILETAYSNLAANPFFQLIGLGNFKSRYDSFGQFIQPKAGWDSITVEDEEWETVRGICVRFDGLKSPNVVSGEDKWPIYSRKNLADHIKDLGENTAGFWRMVRSFETPLGMDDAIYSESDFLAGNAYEKPIWIGSPTRFSSLDPSFTNGGDRCPQLFGSYGIDRNGIKTVCVDRYVLLREDVRKKEPRDYQIAHQFRDNCVKEGIRPQHAALDATAAGSVLWSIIAEEWSDEVLKVDFSGAPSEMSVSPDKTAKQSYDRKVSELWYIGKEFMKYGQLKGIPQEMAREMKARKFETIKGVDGLKIRVETKAKMKERLLFSPDLADVLFVALNLCRVRLGAIPGTETKGRAGANVRFLELAKERNSVYCDCYTDAEDS